MALENTNYNRSIVAKQAAKIIMEEGITDYLFAKRKAAKSLALFSIDSHCSRFQSNDCQTGSLVAKHHLKISFLSSKFNTLGSFSTPTEVDRSNDEFRHHTGGVSGAVLGTVRRNSRHSNQRRLECRFSIFLPGCCRAYICADVVGFKTSQ